MKALRKPFKMRMSITGLNYLKGKKSSLQLYLCSRSAQLTEQECDT